MDTMVCLNAGKKHRNENLYEKIWIFPQKQGLAKQQMTFFANWDACCCMFLKSALVNSCQWQQNFVHCVDRLNVKFQSTRLFAIEWGFEVGILIYQPGQNWLRANSQKWVFHKWCYCFCSTCAWEKVIIDRIARSLGSKIFEVELIFIFNFWRKLRFMHFNHRYFL